MAKIAKQERSRLLIRLSFNISQMQRNTETYQNRFDVLRHRSSPVTESVYVATLYAESVCSPLPENLTSGSVTP